MKVRFIAITVALLMLLLSGSGTAYAQKNQQKERQGPPSEALQQREKANKASEIKNNGQAISQLVKEINEVSKQIRLKIKGLSKNVNYTEEQTNQLRQQLRLIREERIRLGWTVGQVNEQIALQPIPPENMERISAVQKARINALKKLLADLKTLLNAF